MEKLRAYLRKETLFLGDEIAEMLSF